MAGNEGYEFKSKTEADAAIFHHGKLVKMLTGDAAKKFLADVAAGEPQDVMAGASGNARRTSHLGMDDDASGSALGSNGSAHGHKEFRRRGGG